MVYGLDKLDSGQNFNFYSGLLFPINGFLLLDYVSERIENFLNASKVFEKSFDKVEKEKPR